MRTAVRGDEEPLAAAQRKKEPLAAAQRKKMLTHHPQMGAVELPSVYKSKR
jgi:hypothetical protein